MSGAASGGSLRALLGKAKSSVYVSSAEFLKYFYILLCRKNIQINTRFIFKTSLNFQALTSALLNLIRRARKPTQHATSQYSEGHSE